MPAEARAALITFLAGCILTLIAVLYYRHNLNAYRTTRFEEYADKASFLIRDRVLSYEHGLRGTRSAMLAAGPTRMTLQQFQLISASRDPQREFPGSRGFGFIQRVPTAHDQAFLQEVRQLGRRDFRIREISENSDERYVVKYIEPEEPNRAALGLDIGSESTRRESMIKAMRSGLATLTPPITLLQADGETGRGFLLLLAVYPEHPLPLDPIARERAALGATYTPLVIDEVLANINPATEGIALTLSDMDAFDGAIRFFGQASNTTPATLSTSRQLDIFGRTWRADFRAMPQYLSSLPADYTPVFGLFGCLLSVLLATLIHRELLGKTQERLNNQRLRSLIKSAPTALGMFDTNMHYLAVSQRWLDEYGLSDRQVIGLSLYDTFPHLPEKWKVIHQRALQGDELSKDNERLERRDGSIRWMHWAIRPWHHGNGEIGGVIIFTEDVSERYRMITALEAAKEDAEVANRAKTLFLGNMSHEMRTPLHQLSGFVSMFLREDLSEKQSRRLEMMKSSLQRLDTVIGGILTLVDLESRATTVERKPIDLESLCNAVIKMVAESAEKKKLTLSLTVKPLPENLLGDAQHIRTILSCYINNAITFSEHGQITVDVSCLGEDTNEVLVRLAVTDQGIGIPAERLDSIFVEFEQADNSSTRKYGGTGVGLAVVKKLSRLMGGDVGCDSQPGQGSTFWATMKLTKADKQATSNITTADFQI